MQYIRSHGKQIRMTPVNLSALWPRREGIQKYAVRSRTLLNAAIEDRLVCQSENPVGAAGVRSQLHARVVLATCRVFTASHRFLERLATRSDGLAIGPRIAFNAAATKHMHLGTGVCAKRSVIRCRRSMASRVRSKTRSRTSAASTRRRSCPPPSRGAARARTWPSRTGSW